MENKEINRLIAEKVMYFKVIPPSVHEETGFENSGYFVVKDETEDEDEIWISQFEFCPTTEIKDAWKVFEKLQNDWNVNIGTANPYSIQMGVARRDIDRYYCEIYGEKTIIAYAETVPRAICKVALRSVGVEIGL